MRNLSMHARDSLIRHLKFRCSAEQRGRGCQAPQSTVPGRVDPAFCCLPVTRSHFPECYKALPE